MDLLFNSIPELKTFKYGGIRLNIAASCIFFIFSLLPIEKIKNKTSIKLIKHITSYTGGIYYMHYFIPHYHWTTKILVWDCCGIIKWKKMDK